MRVAVMQPYFFPYLGYFQLIHSVDAFVVYDDVNYIKGGWINRNFILGQKGKQRITLPLEAASPNKRINQLSIGGNPAQILKIFRQNYARAPQFGSVIALIEEVIRQPERNLSRFLDTGLQRISDYFGLHPTWHMSSCLKKDNNLRGQDKVLAICQELGATHYINMPGGKILYDAESFARLGIQLSFIEPKPVVYRQFGSEFVPNLSIIDVMMFNSKEQCTQMLWEYEIV